MTTAPWPEPVRLPVRWLVTEGLGRLVVGRAARQGDPQARLIVDPATRADPHPVYEQIRAAGPLVRTRISLITAHHAVAAEVLRSDDFGVVPSGVELPGVLGRLTTATRTDAVSPVLPPSLLAVDPPDHTRYRALVSSVFTARAVARLRDRVAEIAAELLDRLEARAGRGEVVDLVEAYASTLPVAVISEILGVPAADRDRVLRLGEAAAPSLDFVVPWRLFVQTERALREFDRYLAAHLDRLRRDPGDDLLSQLVHAADDEGRLDDRELRSTAGLVLAAGFETTVNLLGTGAWLLMRHPDQLALLREDPARWPTAVDEVLRFEPPVQLTARVARRATTVAGRPVGVGDMVVTLLAAAGRDPAVFADPDRFDVTRANAGRHLAFSAGRHFCLGAALARAEGEVGLRMLFERFPDLALAGEGTWRPTRVLKGFAHLPVRLGDRSGATTAA